MRGPASTSRKRTTTKLWFVFGFPFSSLTSLTPNPKPNPNPQHDGFDDEGTDSTTKRRVRRQSATAREIRQPQSPTYQGQPQHIRPCPNLSNPTNAAHRQHVRGLERTTRKGNDTMRRGMGIQQQKRRKRIQRRQGTTRRGGGRKRI
jgi:hypothetical protein